MLKVSVIIPTYNRAKYLKDAIESVLGQKYQNLEIIIVDDGSKDDTAQIVKSFSSSKIKYIYQANQGRSKARNRAIKLAKGEYIAFLDSDDIFLPGKIQKQVALLDKNSQYAMIYCSAQAVNSQGRKLYPVYRANLSGWIYSEIAFYLPLTIILPTVMVRKDILFKVGLFDENMARFEDIDLWRRISKRYQILGIDEILCIIRRHRGNQMEHPAAVLKSIDYYIRKIYRDDGLANLFLKRKRTAELFCFYGNATTINKKWHQYAIKFYLPALRYWPLVKKYDKYLIQELYQSYKSQIGQFLIAHLRKNL